MHNYFVSFVYTNDVTDKDDKSFVFNGDNIIKVDNCIMVDMIDTAHASAEQLDRMIAQFTEKIGQSMSGCRDIKIVNIAKMN